MGSQAGKTIGSQSSKTSRISFGQNFLSTTTSNTNSRNQADVIKRQPFAWTSDPYEFSTLHLVTSPFQTFICQIHVVKSIEYPAQGITTVWLVSSIRGLDLTKQEKMLVFVCFEATESKPVKPHFPLWRVFFVQTLRMTI